MGDTLRLNPLAFPKNPYHHLVKHYQDGQLLGNRKNNPLLDAELSLQVFCDQERSLQQMQQTSPDLLLAWHWLTTRDQSISGLNRFFMVTRHSTAPSTEKPALPSPASWMKKLHDSQPPDHRHCRRPRLAAGLRAGLAVGCRRQFGDAALGAPSVSPRPAA